MDDPQEFFTDRLGALFDLSFNRFITVSLIKFIYLLAIIVACLTWAALVIGAFTVGPLAGLLGIVIATFVSVLQLLLARLSLEIVVVIFFRIGENTSIIAQRTMDGTKGFPVTPVTPI